MLFTQQLKVLLRISPFQRQPRTSKPKKYFDELDILRQGKKLGKSDTKSNGEM